MQQITFEIENKKDANLLIEIAERLGIKKYILKPPESRETFNLQPSTFNLEPLNLKS